MYENGKIYMGLSDPAKEKIYMYLSQANRHGLIAGASGTGKTVTMKVMAESFSDAGVPVFLCDVKGDVSGLCEPGADSSGMQKRIDKFGLRDTFAYRPYPVTFWDIYGKGGHPIRTTVSDMGPEILARILGLTEVQEGVLNIIFRIADEHGLAIIDLKDLKAMIQYVTENRAQYSQQYGNMAPQSLSAITRALIPLENQGGEEFFGEPMLDVTDWIRTDANGHGMINVLHAVETIKYPKLYAAFLLWMMAELFENLPEVGDPEKPTIVFFFDEAHLLFTDAPKALVQKIEQTVKLIRSKGVGIYFVTQSPSDVPDSVLAQCSNRVQHALRAYTPAEQKAVRTAAQTFRANPAFKTEDVIMQLGTGEALTSFLDEKGIPQIVERTSIICPQSLMAPCAEATKNRVLAQSQFGYKYNTPVDSESAYELLEKRAAEKAEQEEIERQKAELEAERKKLEAEKEKAAREAEKAAQKEAEKKAKEEEKTKAAAQKKKDRIKAKLETQMISTGGQLLRK
ncbi:MAG: DUF853 family protein, partial [Clostridia bacterium]|nr:DUF853 family protein [Clostridia bacterium]